MKGFLFLTIVSFFAQQALSQTKLQSYFDIGENNVSNGVFMKNLYRCSYQYSKYNITAGVQLDLKSINPNIVTGSDFIGTREFQIKNFPIEVKGFFMLNRFSDLMYETNWGGRVATNGTRHFLFELGANFKTYIINSVAKEEYNINDSNCKLGENFTLTYTITTYLKPQGNNWNIGFSCTNVDYYVINQSTNPVINIKAMYPLNPRLALNLNAWYKQAGIFNIHANYFGYFFRGGLSWKI